MKFELV